MLRGRLLPPSLLLLMLPDGLDWLSYLAGEGRGKAGKAKKKAAQGPSSHEVLSLVICKGAQWHILPKKVPIHKGNIENYIIRLITIL